MEPVIDRNFKPLHPMDVVIEATIQAAYYQRALDEGDVRLLTATDEQFSDLQRKNHDRVVWLNDNHLVQYMEPEVWFELVKIPLGGWSNIRIAQAAKRVFVLETLLWDLGLGVEMPSFEDARAIFSLKPRFDLLEQIPFGDPLDIFIVGADLRDHEDMARFHEMNSAYYLRAELEAQGDSSRFNSSEKRVLYQAMGEKLVALGLISNVLDCDLPVVGQPFSQLPEDTKTLVGDIAAIRLQTHNWVINRDIDEDPASHEA